MIAKKAEGIGFMYAVSTLLCGILIGVGIKAAIFTSIVGVIGVLLCGYHFVKYLLSPYEIIRAGNDGMLYLPKDVVLDPRDIVDVSYDRASGRGFQYKWGEIIIITRIESFRFNYVSDCEDVSKELTRIMYESKK
ncbi:MAG: hypothetical protein J6S71_06260 [Clostridia bacterium]|nr:hypothetical protein [Clostridia bacterium]